MWEKVALLPLAFQSLICPSRTSDTILLVLLSWFAGCLCGSALTALVLSPSLRRCLVRAAAFALREAIPEGGPGFDRLQRYRQ